MTAKNITLILLCFFILASCRKEEVTNNAKVAYEVTAINRTSGPVQWTTGFGIGKQIVFKGDGTQRVEEYVLALDSSDFFTPGAMLNTIEIPAGTYSNAEFNFQMIPSRDPALSLHGFFNKNGTTIPVSVLIDQFVEMKTKKPSVTLEAGRNYKARLSLDVSQILNGVSTTQLSNATLTNGKLVISYLNNPELFLAVINNINNVLKHNVELN